MKKTVAKVLTLLLTLAAAHPAFALGDSRLRIKLAAKISLKK